MKNFDRKLRELDESELAALQEAVHDELRRRQPSPDLVANERTFRVVGNDDTDDSYDTDEAPLRRRAA